MEGPGGTVVQGRGAARERLGETEGVKTAKGREKCPEMDGS